MTTTSQPHARASDSAVLFMDILGFQNAVNRGPQAIIPIYDLLAHSFYPHSQPNGEKKIRQFFAASDSVMASALEVETVLAFALQVFTSFFDNLDQLATNPNTVPVLVRGAVAYDWMVTPYIVEPTMIEPARERPLNIVGKGLTEAYRFSERPPVKTFGACLRISHPAFQRLRAADQIDADAISSNDGSSIYYELNWPLEVFQEWPDAASRYLHNVRLARERLQKDFEPKEDELRHWDETIKLLTKCGSKLGLLDSRDLLTQHADAS